jgi:hypothetical protein
VGAFYSFSFDVGPGVDLIRLANKLLKHDMASVAGSPSRDGLRVGRRLRKSVATQEEAQRVADFLEVVESGNFEWYKMFRLDWRMTSRIGWAGRKLIASYLAKYLMIWALYGQAGIKSRTSTRTPTRESGDDEPDPITKSRDMVKEAADRLRKSVFDQHISGALRLRLSVNSAMIATT